MTLLCKSLFILSLIGASVAWPLVSYCTPQQEVRTLIIAGNPDDQLIVDSINAAYAISAERGPTFALVSNGLPKTLIAEKSTSTYSSFAWIQKNKLAEFKIPDAARDRATARNVNKAIDQLGSDLDGTLVIFVSDHGAPSEKNGEFGDGHIILGPTSTRLANKKETSLELMGDEIKLQTMKMSDLESAIRRLPPSVKVKVVADNCFSGGFHEIAFRNPNVCSASSTDAASISYGSDYSFGFWKARYLDRPTSLAKAHATGTAWTVSANEARSTLSSMAYIDKILHVGPYDKNAREPILTFDDFIHTPVPELLDRLLLGTPTTGINKTLGLSMYETPVLCALRSTLGKLNEFNNELQASLTDAQLGQVMEFVPANAREDLTAALRDWKSKQAEYNRRLTRIDTNMNREIENWRKKVEMLPSSAQLMYKEYVAYDKVEQERVKLANEIKLDYVAMQQLAKLSRFLKTASDEQKKTLKRLLECEWEAF